MDYVMTCISYVQLNKFWKWSIPKDLLIMKLFCVCSRPCMVTAAHVVREKRQVNAPRTVRTVEPFVLILASPPGTPGNSWCACTCTARSSKSWPFFRPKNFIFHTRFQIWPLWNPIIIRNRSLHTYLSVRNSLSIHRKLIADVGRMNPSENNHF